MIKFKQVFLASVLASSMVVTPVFADDVSNLQNSKNAAQSEVNSLQMIWCQQVSRSHRHRMILL